MLTRLCAPPSVGGLPVGNSTVIPASVKVPAPNPQRAAQTIRRVLPIPPSAPVTTATTATSATAIDRTAPRQPNTNSPPALPLRTATAGAMGVEPTGPIDPEQVYTLGVQQLQHMADTGNNNALLWWRNRLAQWDQSFELHGYDEGKNNSLIGYERPKPPLMLVLDFTGVVYPNYPALVYSQLPVMEQPPLPEQPANEPQEGSTVFGLPVEGWPKEAYYAQTATERSSGPDGRTAEYNGRTFVLRMLYPGSWRQMYFWELK